MNMNPEQKEIDFVRLIQILLLRKKLIIFFLIGIMIISISVNLTLPPTYETKAVITINVQDIEQKNKVDLLAFIEQAKNKTVVQNILDNMSNQNFKSYNEQIITRNLTIEKVKDSESIIVSLKGKEPKEIATITNAITYELTNKIEVSNKLATITEYKKQLDKNIIGLKVKQGEVEEAEKLLKNTPEKVVTIKSVSDDPLMQSLVSENMAVSNKKAATLQMVSESINPVFTQINSKLSEDKVKLAALQNEKNVLEGKILENEKWINESQNNGVVDSLWKTDDHTSITIIPATESSEKIGPKIVINLVVSGVIAVVLAILLAFGIEFFSRFKLALNNNAISK